MRITHLRDKGRTIVHVTCRQCKGEHDVHVATGAFHRWQNGDLIQNAVPELGADDRELLMSGTCGPCFDTLFANLDEDE